ncbi:hypothetical protein BVRB_035190, partial [Beta vulgaris subsp. vulgaris]
GLSVPKQKNRLELAHYEKVRARVVLASVRWVNVTDSVTQVLDVVSECLMEVKSEPSTGADLALATKGIEVGFAFSARLFQSARLPAYSDAELDLMFARTAEDILAGRYPADEKDYMALGVMQ